MDHKFTRPVRSHMPSDYNFDNPARSHAKWPPPYGPMCTYCHVITHLIRRECYCQVTITSPSNTQTFLLLDSHNFARPFRRQAPSNQKFTCNIYAYRPIRSPCQVTINSPAQFTFIPPCDHKFTHSNTWAVSLPVIANTRAAWEVGTSELPGQMNCITVQLAARILLL
jgi:hypothetical protein